MYCIVDIETTGGSHKSGKITEIAAFLHDGHRCVDEFISLINPDTPIPSFITNLTGISNEMVADAPRFEEIAADLNRFMSNAIFVAHNVSFDYGFLREAFRKVGIEFKRRKLCTVQLSRSTFPGLPSYSLGKISRELDIELDGAHRAAADAKATMHLFERIISQQSMAGLFDANFGVASVDDLPSPYITREVLESIPDECGVFRVFNERDELIYVKRSSELVNAICAKFKTRTAQTDRDFLADAYRIDFQLTGSPLLAQLLEAHDVLAYNPRYNFGKFSMKAQYGLYGQTRNGLDSWVLKKRHLGDEPKMVFSTYFEGIDYLKFIAHRSQSHLVETFKRKWSTEFIFKDPGSGIPRTFSDVLNRENAVIVDEGVSIDEQTFIWMQHGEVQGYGTLHTDTEVTEVHPEMLQFKFTPYPELEMIVRQFKAKGRFESWINAAPFVSEAD